MYNKNKLQVDNAKKLTTAKDVIYDLRGQWAHPGKITRIPSPNITMQGVPYPVYGVGSNGQKQMMYPGQEYDFGSASYVDEYPMLQRGGRTPIYVNSKNDPRYRAYQDSLNAYNNMLYMNSFKTRENINGVPVYDWSNFDKSKIKPTSVKPESWKDFYKKDQPGKGQLAVFKKPVQPVKYEKPEEGARTPIYVESKNDPAYKSYSDSLALYNKNKRIYESGIETKAKGLKYEDAIKGKPYGERWYLEEGIPFDIIKKPVQPVKVKSKETVNTLKKLNKQVVNPVLPEPVIDYSRFPEQQAIYDAGWDTARYLKNLEAEQNKAAINYNASSTRKIRDPKNPNRLIDNPNWKSKPTLVTNPYKRQNGGRAPIYVNDPNDPRLEAYADSLSLYNKGEKSSGLYSMNYGPAGNHRALWRNVSNAPLPEGYTVPGTIQPIEQRITQASFPRYVFANSGSNAVQAGSQRQYSRRVSDIYKEPVQPVIYSPDKYDPTDPRLAAYQQAFDKTFKKEPLPEVVLDPSMFPEDKPVYDASWNTAAYVKKMNTPQPEKRIVSYQPVGQRMKKNPETGKLEVNKDFKVKPIIRQNGGLALIPNEDTTPIVPKYTVDPLVQKSFDNDISWMKDWINNRTVVNPSMQDIYNAQKDARLKSLSNLNVRFEAPEQIAKERGESTLGLATIDPEEKEKLNLLIEEMNSASLNTKKKLKKKDREEAYKNFDIVDNKVKDYAKRLSSGDIKLQATLPAFSKNDLEFYRKINNVPRNSTYAHEISHAGDILGNAISPEEKEIIKKYISTDDTYLNDPTEVKARVNVLRRVLNLDPTIQYDKNTLPYDKLKNYPDGNIQDLLKITTPETIYNLLNETSQVKSDQNLQYAQNGGQLITYKDSKDYIASHANIDPSLDPKQNEWIKKQILTGNWGYDFDKKSLVKLDKGQQEYASPEAQVYNLAKNSKQAKNLVDAAAGALRGVTNPDGSAGTARMSDKAYQDYITKEVAANDKLTWQNPLMYAPGMVATGFLNPAAGAIVGAGDVSKNVYEGNYSQAGLDIALSTIPFGKLLKGYKKAVDVPTQLPGSSNSVAEASDYWKKRIDNDKLSFRDFQTNKEVFNIDPEDFRNFESPEMYDEALKIANEEKQKWYNKNIPLRGGYSDIPQFNKQVQDLKTLAEYGKRPLLNQSNFYTPGEIHANIKKQGDYYTALNEYEKLNPQSGSSIMMDAFSGQSPYMDKFHNLNPNLSLPNWGEKFYPSLDITRDLEKSIPYSKGISTPLSSKNLKYIGSKENKLLDDAKGLNKLQNKDHWFYTGNPKDIVSEMRGSLGLSFKDIEKLSDGQLNSLVKTLQKRATKQSLNRLKGNLENPYTGKEAFSTISPNKYGGNIYQNGGVKYDSPEYRKAYREGTIARQVGDEYIMNLPDAEALAEQYAVTAKSSMSEKYPYWNNLSAEQKRYINDSSPIGNAVRSKATHGYGIKGNPTFSQSVNTLAKQGAKEVGNIAFETTGIPSAYRIGSNPLGTLEGLYQTGADMVASPYAVYDKWLGSGKGFEGVNPLTGEYYGEGLDELGDVASVIPGLGIAGKAVKPLGKYLTKQSALAKSKLFPLLNEGNPNWLKELNLRPLPGSPNTPARVLANSSRLSNVEHGIGVEPVLREGRRRNESFVNLGTGESGIRSNVPEQMLSSNLPLKDKAKNMFNINLENRDIVTDVGTYFKNKTDLSKSGKFTFPTQERVNEILKNNPDIEIKDLYLRDSPNVVYGEDKETAALNRIKEQNKIFDEATQFNKDWIFTDSKRADELTKDLDKTINERVDYGIKYNLARLNNNFEDFSFDKMDELIAKEGQIEKELLSITRPEFVKRLKNVKLLETPYPKEPEYGVLSINLGPPKPKINRPNWAKNSSTWDRKLNQDIIQGHRGTFSQNDPLLIRFSDFDNTSLNKLSESDRNYLAKDAPNIGGVKTMGNTITLGEYVSKPKFSLFEPKPIKATLPGRQFYDIIKSPLNFIKGTHEEMIPGGNPVLYKETILKLKDPMTVAGVGAHEGAHGIQSNYNFSNILGKYDSKYKYFTNEGTPFGEKFGKYLIDPVEVKPSEEDHYDTWLSSGNELHSETQKARFKLYKQLVDNGLDSKIAMKQLQEPTDGVLDMLIEDFDLNKHFKKDAPKEVKREIIKNYMPAIVTAAGTAATLGALQEKKVGGVVNISQLKPTQDLKKKKRKVINSIKEAIANNEKINPISVEEVNGKLKIKDGHHRYMAYKEMGVDDIPVSIKYAAAGGQVDPDEAKKMLKTGSAYRKSLTDKQRRYFAETAGTDLNGNDIDSQGNVYNDDGEIIGNVNEEEYRRGGNVLGSYQEAGQVDPLVIQNRYLTEKMRVDEANRKAAELAQFAMYDDVAENVFDYSLPDMNCNIRGCQIASASGQTLAEDIEVNKKKYSKGESVPIIPGIDQWVAESKKMGYSEIDANGLEPGDRVMIYTRDNSRLQHAVIYGGTDVDGNPVYYDDPGSGKEWRQADREFINSRKKRAFRYVGNLPSYENDYINIKDQLPEEEVTLPNKKETYGVRPQKEDMSLYENNPVNLHKFTNVNDDPRVAFYNNLMNIYSKFKKPAQQKRVQYEK
jgi:hypothetical protein